MFNPFPLRSAFPLQLAKASASFKTSWRFTHRILTVLPSRFLAPAPWPSSQLRDPSSFPLYRFQGSLAVRSSGVFTPCLADSFASITKNPSLVNSNFLNFLTVNINPVNFGLF